MLGVLLVLLVLLGVSWLLLERNFRSWKALGVPGPEPAFLFGNVKDGILANRCFGELFSDLYTQTKSLPYAGVYMMIKRLLLINDLDLIKTILIKDFVHFSDRNPKFNDKMNPLFSHLLISTGDKWKKLRNKLSPTFTSNKMKYMFETMAQCGAELTAYLEDHVSENDLDVKELMAKFNTDVIVSCAFGLECNSFKNPDTEFRRMGRKLLNLGFFRNTLNILVYIFPKILNHLWFSIPGEDVNTFFCSTVKKTIEHREQNNIVRNDFLQLLIQLKNDGFVADDESGETRPPEDNGARLTLPQIAAQVFGFFVAGFETTSTTASFALYELALNPHLQDQLRAEMDGVLIRHNGKVKYEALGEMTYLTKVIEETLRKYPPLPAIMRFCTKDYIVPGTGVKIDKDTPVAISIFGIQRDPEYFPNPDKFDPERFTADNKASRHHFSYLPFGEGPRNCIGKRFGMMQVRLGLVSVLTKYEVSVCQKTTIPMEFDKKSLVLTANGGVWLKLTKRSSRP